MTKDVPSGETIQAMLVTRVKREELTKRLARSDWTHVRRNWKAEKQKKLHLLNNKKRYTRDCCLQKSIHDNNKK